MRKIRKITSWISCLLAICLALAFWVIPVKASASEVSSSPLNSDSDFDCTYSVSKDKPYIQYGSSEVITYTAEEAQAAGIPEGYSDTVVSVKPMSSSAKGYGVLLDFTAWELPVGLVESISFRFYIEESDKNTNDQPQLRIISPVTGSWMYQPGKTPSVAGEWTTETVENANALFLDIADKNGYLDKFELSVRLTEHVAFYIDSVKLNIKENNGVGPNIICNAGDAVSVSLGSAFSLGATAYDAQEKRAVDLEYVWEDGVTLDENGMPNAAGVYSLTLRAADFYGNESTKVITVTVLEPDLEAPVIHFSLTKIYAQVGMIPQLNVEVTDNRKVAHVAYAWSEGALDNKGALTEGTHTYTITAKDDSNNESVLAITIYVTKDEPEYDNVIDEEVLSPRLTVTFDGENGEIYKYGEKVKKPADPVKEDTEDYAYTFEGWYNGDVAWNFDKDIVVEDMNLVAKWTKIPLSPDDTENSDASSEQNPADSKTPEQSSTETESSEQNSNQNENVSSSSTSVNNGNAGKKRGCSGAMQFSLFLPVLLCACIAYRKKNSKNE